MNVPIRTKQFAPGLVSQHQAANSMKDIEIAMDNSRSIAMTFKNEYVPPLEQETSEFFRKARQRLNTGHTTHDKWTVDREREMVLFKRGAGHSMEAHNEDYWSFLTVDAEYHVDTELLAKSEVSPDKVAVTRSISFRGDSSLYPDHKALTWIKEALQEYKDWGVISDYKNCQLTLVDVRTGKGI